MTWKIEAVLKDKKASEWVLARTGKIYPIKVIYECARIKILTFKDEVPEDPAVTENILVTVKGKNPKWKLTVELLNVRDASSVSAVPVGTVWISSALCCDQTAEGLPSLLPQRNKRGAGGGVRRRGGCLLILVRKLSSHNDAVLTLANNFQTSTPSLTRGFALFTSTWWKRWVNIPPLLSCTRPISVHGA